MVHFSDYFDHHQVSEWSEKYMRYEDLKLISNELANFWNNNGASVSGNVNQTSVEFPEISLDNNAVRIAEVVEEKIKRADFSEEVIGLTDHDEFSLVTIPRFHKESGARSLDPNGTNFVAMIPSAYNVPMEIKFFEFFQHDLFAVNEFFLEQLLFFEEQIQVLKNQIDLLNENKSNLGSYYNLRMGKMKCSTKELFRGLSLLADFQLLNYTGFVKILKKHDLKSKWNAATKIFMPLVAGVKFSHIDLVPISQDLKIFYINKFGDGDYNRISDLKSRPPPISHFLIFAMGWASGVVTALTVYLIILYYTTQFSSDSDYLKTFVVFRALILIGVYITVWGCDVFIYNHWSLNYVFVLELDPSTALNYENIFLIMWGYSLLLLYMLTSFCSMLVFGFENQGYVTFVMWIVIIVVLFCPFDFWHYNTRIWLLKTFFRIVSAPFTHVSFKHFFSADQLCSLVRVFQDFIYIFCFYGSGEFIDATTKCSTIGIKMASSLIALCPYFWRMLQCARRYYDDENRSNINLYNMGKYFCSCAVIISNFLATYSNSAFITLWIIFATISGLYSSIWDILMDWGLGKFSSSNWFLRDHLYFPPIVYYIAIPLNCVLRFAWIVTISPKFFGFDFSQDYFLLLMAFLEIVRRGIWNIFRIEHEHTDNMEHYRVVASVPDVIHRENNSHVDFPAPKIVARQASLSHRGNKLIHSNSFVFEKIPLHDEKLMTIPENSVMKKDI